MSTVDRPNWRNLILYLLIIFLAGKSLGFAADGIFNLPALSQLDPGIYRDRELMQALDTVPNSLAQVSVSKLACAATTYVMLERARAGGDEYAMVDDFYVDPRRHNGNGPGAKRPNYLGQDVPLDAKSLLTDLRQGKPVVLHGKGGPLREHFVLVVGTESKNGALTLVVNDPWPMATDPSSPRSVFMALHGNSVSHDTIPGLKFEEMRRLSDYRLRAGLSAHPAPTTEPTDQVPTQSTKVRLTLKDGAILVGTTTLTSITFKTSFASLDLKVHELAYLESDSVELTTETKMNGVLVTSRIPVNVAGQTLQIEFQLVRNAEFGDYRKPSSTQPAGPTPPPVSSPGTPPRPSEEEAKRLFVAKVSKDSEGVVSALTFRKTDGRASIRDGVPLYAMAFETTVFFSSECFWIGANAPFKEKTLDFSQLRIMDAQTMRAYSLMGRKFNKGHYVISGAMGLSQTESGWHIIQMQYEKLEETGPVAFEQNPRTADAVPRDRSFGVSGMKNSELLDLLSSTVTSPLATDVAFTSDDGKISGFFASELVRTKSSSAFRGFFKTDEQEPSPDGLTVTCQKTALLNKNPSLEEVVNAWRKDMSTTYPGSVLSEPIRTTLLGVEALCYSATIVENGIQRIKVTTVTVSNRQIVGVYLHAKRANIQMRWSAYKRLCNSIQLTGK